MTHRTPSAQANAARALAQMLTRATTAGLPAAAWSIPTEPHVELEGVLPTGDTRALRRWANEFGADINWEPIAGLGYPEVHFVIDGVSVRVWTRLTVAAARLALGIAGTGVA